MPDAAPTTPADVGSTGTTYLRDASVNVTTTGAQVAAARGNRRVLILYNSHASQDVHISLGTSCTTTKATFVLKTTDPYFEIADYAGPVWACTATGTSTLFVTELT